MQPHLFGAPYALKVEDYRRQETDWASRLRGLSLVSEAGFDLDESLDAFRFVLRSYQGQSSRREDRVRLLRRYPASLLAGLTGIASSRYEEGTFWPKVGDAVGVEITQVIQTELSDGFRHGLDCFFLTRFDTPLKNVGEILMHAGIPAHSISGFLRLLNDRSVKRSDLTGEDFCEWAGGLDRLAVVAKGLDVPTWRFLKEGGEFAIDLTNRFLAFLDAATAGQSSLAEEALGTIPPVLARVADEFLRLGGVQSSSRSRGIRRRRLSPQIVYAEGQIQVRLPILNSSSDIEDVWAFSTAGQSWQRSMRASQMERSATMVLEPLTRSIADVVIQHRSSKQEWRLGVIDRATDLMAFDQSTGRLIPPTSQLPASWVWLAFPTNDCPLPTDALEIEGDLSIIEHADPPYGWKGWYFVKVDLSSVSKLRSKKDGLRWRFVSTIKQPMLKLGDPVRYVRSNHDSPIYSTRPTLILPPVPEQTGGAETPKWRVQLANASGEAVVSSTIAGESRQIEVDPWAGHPSGIIGEFELHVTRVLGQSARFELTIAEGLEASANPQFRSIDRDGRLEPTLVRICLGSWQQELRIESADIAKEIAVDSNGSSLLLRALVDHMWLDLQQGEFLPRRATSSLALEIEKLDDMVLRLRLPTEERGCITLLSQQSAVGQEEYISGDSSGIARIPLSRFHDMAQRFGGGELYCESNGKVSLIGRIRPRKLISDVTILSGRIAVERLYENLDLQIQLRLDNAPWLQIQPLRLPPGESSIQLPEIVKGRGPLTIAVQPFDPWALDTVSSEQTRDRENKFHIDAETDFLRDSLEDRFVHWVAGGIPIPDDRGGIEFALDAYGAIRQFRPRERADSLASDVAQLTEKVGPRFLAVAASSQWSQSSHTRLLVEGWPATAKTMSYPVNPDLWRRSPYLGLVLSLGCFRDEETSTELIERAGNDAWSILSEGRDPAIRAGTLDSGADILADQPRDIQDRSWKNFIAVPGRCLDEEQRILNARTLFDSRSDIRLHALIKASPTIVDEMSTSLEQEYGELATKPLHARSAPKNWRQLSQTSLALAFAARMTARDADAAEDIHRFARNWYADLADCAPGFVEQDLILAELWLTHWERR